MNCSNCDSQSVADAKFCDLCGTVIPVASVQIHGEGVLLAAGSQQVTGQSEGALRQKALRLAFKSAGVLYASLIAALFASAGINIVAGITADMRGITLIVVLILSVVIHRMMPVCVELAHLRKTPEYRRLPETFRIMIWIIYP